MGALVVIVILLVVFSPVLAFAAELLANLIGIAAGLLTAVFGLLAMAPVLIIILVILGALIF